MKLSMLDQNRQFEVTAHALVYKKHSRDFGQFLFASFVGVPEAVRAYSANILMFRPIEFDDLTLRKDGSDYYRKEKAIGLGDLVHGVVMSPLCSLTRMEKSPDYEKLACMYVLAFDGDINSAVAKHVMRRFGLPAEWKDDYYHLFEDHIETLEVYVNPELGEWTELKAVEISLSEEDALRIMSEALMSRRLVVPETDLNGQLNPEWTINEYMVQNAEVLAKQLSKIEPIHDFNKPLDQSFGTLKRVPFPAQAHAIQALALSYEQKGNANNVLSGDMGSGKSLMATGVTHVIHERKKRRTGKGGFSVLLSAPGITIPKWDSKEIKGTVHAQVHHIRNHNDALALLRKVKNGYRPSGLEYYLVGIDRAKLGSDTYFGGIWKRVKGEREVYAFHCPDCGQPIMVPEKGNHRSKKKDYRMNEWSDFAEGKPPTHEEILEARRKNAKRVTTHNHATWKHTTAAVNENGLPAGFSVKWKKGANVTKKCENDVLLVGQHNNMDRDAEESMLKRVCHTQLFRPALAIRKETKNKPRLNISHILKRLRGWFDLYIADEVHQSKGGSSGRGDAFAQMVKSAKKVLMLTGTLTTGKSTSVKEILWRTDTRLLLDNDITYKTGDIEWAERYGKLEEVVPIEDAGDKGVVTKQVVKEAQVKEAPGIAPEMIAKFLIHKSVFLELPDLGLPLVEVKEIPEFINMDEEHAIHYNGFYNAMYEYCAKASAVSGGGKSINVWAKFNPSTILYADRPELGQVVDFYEHQPNPELPRKLVKRIVGEPIGDEYTYHAKERWLLDRVKRELEENRGCVIYNSYTGDYKMNERIQTILARHGISSRIMDEPDTQKRSEVLAKFEEEKVQVVICNMKLVEVGLDLRAPRSSITATCSGK